MNLLQLPRSPLGRRRPNRRGRVLFFIALGVAAAALLIRAGPTRIALPTWTAPAEWWEGLHTDADSKPMPRLALARAENAVVRGYLEIPFDKGFDLRLPVFDVVATESRVSFSVDDPHGRTTPPRPDRYLLQKTGPNAGTLYRLRFGYGGPAAGLRLPTNLDKEHHRVANLKREWPAPPDR